MGPTEKARSAGLVFCGRAKGAWGGVEGGSRRQKIQLAGSKDGVWVYTQPAEESKGNPGQDRANCAVSVSASPPPFWRLSFGQQVI
jgi:hypothetical protein